MNPHHRNRNHNLPPPVISLLSSSSDESSDDDDIQIVSVTQPSRPSVPMLLDDDDDDEDDDIEIVSVKLAPTPSRPYHRSPSLTAPPSKFPKFTKSSCSKNSPFPTNSPSTKSPLKIEKIQHTTPNPPIDLDPPPEPQPPPPLVIPPISLYPSGLQLSKHQDSNSKRHGPHPNLTCSFQDILQGKSGEYESNPNNACPDLVATLQFTHTIEPRWFLSNLPASTTDVTIAYQALEKLTESDETKASDSKQHVKPNLIQIQPPPLGSHNTKMMILLFRDDSIKVVIHTGNLMEHDWRSKTLAIYTTPFLHFKSPSASPCSSSDALQHSPSSNFERILLQYLDSYRDETVNEWRKRLEKYDFGECRAKLIPSVPGIHTGSSLNDYGMNRLKQVVEQQEQSGKRYVPEAGREGVVVQIPSLSNLHPAEYSDTWLPHFLHALTHSKSHSLQRTDLKSEVSHDSEILPDSESMQGLMTKVIIQLNESESESGLHSVPSNCMLRKFLTNQTCPPYLSLPSDSQMTAITRFLIPSSSPSRNHLSSASSTLPSGQLSDNPQSQDAPVHLTYHLFTSAGLSNSSWGVPVLRQAGLSIRNWDMGVAVCDSLFKTEYHTKVYLIPSSSPLLQPPPPQTLPTSQPHQIPPFPYPLPPLPPFPSPSSPITSPSPPSLSSLFVSNPPSTSSISSSATNSTAPHSLFPSSPVSSDSSPFLTSDTPVLIVPIPLSIPTKMEMTVTSPVKLENDVTTIKLNLT